MWLMIDARGQGPRVPDRHRRRHGRRTVSALPRRRKTRTTSKKSAGSATCASRARASGSMLTGAARRRIFGDYQATEPSRFLEEIPAELVDRIEPAASAPRWSGGYELRNPVRPALRPRDSRARGRRARDVRLRKRRSVGVGCARRHARPPSTVRRRHGRRRRRSRRRLQGHRAIRRRSARRSCSRASRGSSRREPVREVTRARSSSVSSRPALAAPHSASLGVRPRLVRLRQRRHRHEPIAFGQIHQPHALRVAADRPQVAGLHADDLALLGHEQQLVAVGDAGDADDQAVALARLDVLEADAAARLAAVLADVGALAVAVLADGQQRRVVGSRPPSRRLRRPRAAACRARRRPCGPSAARRLPQNRIAMPLRDADDEILRAVGLRDRDQPIVVVDLNRDDAGRARIRERGRDRSS